MTAPPLETDASLLLRAAVGGDRAAMKAVSRAWWPSVKRWCLLDLGHPEQADDAAQDVLVRLIRSIGTFDPERPFRPWLRTLTRNACRDVMNQQRRDRGEVPSVAAPYLDPAHPLDLARAKQTVLKALGVLTPRQREVFDLVDRQGLNATEAGALLEIQPSTVRVLLRQARGALRIHLLETSPELIELLRTP